MRYPQSWKKTELRDGSVTKFEYQKDGESVITLLVTTEKVGDRSQEKYLFQLLIKIFDWRRYTNLLQGNILDLGATSQTNVEATTLGGVPANRVSFYSNSLQITGRYYQGKPSIHFISLIVSQCGRCTRITL